MQLRLQHHGGGMTAVMILALTYCHGIPALAAQTYKPINPTMADRTITLTGKDLTIDQVIAVARGGARVALSPEARQRSADRFGILLEGAAEGMPIYG